MKTILYTDGGCHGNANPDLSKRIMIVAVSDEAGNVLVDKTQEGGSNNIAELLAVKEALMWCVTHNVDDLELRTDSMNNLAWVDGRIGKKLNDRNAVLVIKSAIDALRLSVKLEMVWVPRENNKAGHFIEEKYTL